MAQTIRCPRCDKELDASHPHGLCAACLMRQVVDAQQVSDSPPVTETSPHDLNRPSSSFRPPSPRELADSFPQLEIFQQIGQGGMGAVYRARQISLDRIVALKILPSHLSADPSFAERFTREAQAMARLNHPNIVSSFEVGQTDQHYYLLMEYVDGINLRQAIADGQLEPKEALSIVSQVCEALQYAHDEGIVHRDIKPENILIDRKGRAKIADFGLAKMLRRNPVQLTLTQTNQVMGTLHYMAPEQVEQPLAVDHRADIFSLGVVFYELLTGHLPLGRFELPSENQTLDPALDRIVLRALEREPARRYQFADQIKTDVHRVSSNQLPPVQKPIQPGLSAGDPRDHRPADLVRLGRISAEVQALREKLHIPALLLIVIGCAGFIMHMVPILSMETERGVANMFVDRRQLTFATFFAIVPIIHVSILITIGIQLRRLRHYRITHSMIRCAALPMSFAAIFSTPLLIWLSIRMKKSDASHWFDRDRELRQAYRAFDPVTAENHRRWSGNRVLFFQYLGAAVLIAFAVVSFAIWKNRSNDDSATITNASERIQNRLWQTTETMDFEFEEHVDVDWQSDEARLIEATLIDRLNLGSEFGIDDEIRVNFVGRRRVTIVFPRRIGGAEIVERRVTSQGLSEFRLLPRRDDSDLIDALGELDDTQSDVQLDGETVATWVPVRSQCALALARKLGGDSPFLREVEGRTDVLLRTEDSGFDVSSWTVDHVDGESFVHEARIRMRVMGAMHERQWVARRLREKDTADRIVLVCDGEVLGGSMFLEPSDINPYGQPFFDIDATLSLADATDLAAIAVMGSMPGTLSAVDPAR